MVCGNIRIFVQEKAFAVIRIVRHKVQESFFCGKQHTWIHFKERFVCSIWGKNYIKMSGRATRAIQGLNDKKTTLPQKHAINKKIHDFYSMSIKFYDDWVKIVDFIKQHIFWQVYSITTQSQYYISNSCLAPKWHFYIKNRPNGILIRYLSICNKK